MNINGIRFTERELDIISCLICGKTAKNIAHLLKISPNTVNVHIRNISARLQKSSKTDIVKFVEQSEEYHKLRQRYDTIIGKSTSSLVSPKKHFFLFPKIAIFVGAIILTLIPTKLFFSKPEVSIKSISPYVSKEILLERKDILDEIDKNINQNRVSHIILTGEGGFGKTTLARNYLNQKDADVIFEINGENRTMVWQSVYMLAHLLASDNESRNQVDLIESLGNKDAKNKKITEFVARKLKEKKSWYLLFDNVNSFEDIQECYPTDKNVWGNGIALITTRNAHLCDNALIENKKTIKVDELTENEKTVLFNKITKSHNSMLSLNTVPSSPLDVCIAAYYVKSTGISFSDYALSLCNKNNDILIQKMLNSTIGYSNTRYSIVTASFDKIIEQNERNIDLLLFICLLSPKNIPVRYLMKLSNSEDVNNFIFLLKKYALAEVDQGNLIIHQVTQQIGLQYLRELQSNDAFEKTLDKIVYAITEFNELVWYYYDDQKYQMTYKELNEIIPHLEQLLKLLPQLKTKNEKLYTQRINLALLYARAPELPRADVGKMTEEILQKNEGEINGYDLIVLMLQSVYCSLESPIEKDEKTLFKCISESKKINAHNLLALAEVYLATFYCSLGNSELSQKFLDKSMARITSLKMRLLLNYRYCSVCLKNYSSPDDIKSAIQFTLETLKLLKADKLFHMTKEKYNDLEGESKNCVTALRRILVSLYNAIGDTENAQKNYDEAMYFYTNRREYGNSEPIGLINVLNIEYANTLIKLGKLKQAEELVDSVIKIKLSANDFQNLFRAYTYKAIIEAKMKKWKNVKQSCQLAQKFLSEVEFKETNVIRLILLANLIRADVNLGQSSFAKSYVEELVKLSNSLLPPEEKISNSQIQTEKDLSDIMRKILRKTETALD